MRRIFSVLIGGRCGGLDTFAGPVFARGRASYNISYLGRKDNAPLYREYLERDHPLVP